MREFISVHLSDRHPGIGTVVLTRDPTNSLTRQAYRELASAAAEVAGRRDIASVIIFGGHEIFCAGDDMAELQTLDRDEAEAADRVRREAIDAVAALPKPTVAEVLALERRIAKVQPKLTVVQDNWEIEFFDSDRYNEARRRTNKLEWEA